jgi:hypothetical protein
MRALLAPVLLAGLATAASPTVPGAAAQDMCEVMAIAAWRTAHNRNLGAAFEEEMAKTRIISDQRVRRTAEQMTRDLYDMPQITPQEAQVMSRAACGWPNLRDTAAQRPPSPWR